MVPSVPFGNVFEQIAITERSGLQFTDVLVAIEQRMILLQDMTREMPDGRLRLQLQRRLSGDGAVSLRWVRGVRGSMMPEMEVLQKINGYQEKVREWYLSVYAEARWLNTQERLCRAARKEFSHLSSVLTEVSSSH